jgi:hypothetical protein
MKNSARGDSSTGSELKSVEEACREASRTVEPCGLCTTSVLLRLRCHHEAHEGHEGFGNYYISNS